MQRVAITSPKRQQEAIVSLDKNMKDPHIILDYALTVDRLFQAFLCVRESTYAQYIHYVEDFHWIGPGRSLSNTYYFLWPLYL